MKMGIGYFENICFPQDGGADIFLDWLDSQFQALPVLLWDHIFK